MMNDGRTVTVYSKPACQACTMTKRALESRAIDFTEGDLLDEGNLAAAKALGHLAAPVVVVSYADGRPDEDWSGFQPGRIEALAAA